MFLGTGVRECRAARTSPFDEECPRGIWYVSGGWQLPLRKDTLNGPNNNYYLARVSGVE